MFPGLIGLCLGGSCLFFVLFPGLIRLCLGGSLFCGREGGSLFLGFCLGAACFVCYKEAPPYIGALVVPKGALGFAYLGRAPCSIRLQWALSFL